LRLNFSGRTKGARGEAAKVGGSVVRKEPFSTPILGTRQPRLLATISSAGMADKALIFQRKGMLSGAAA
jgi:hypothetical protein